MGLFDWLQRKREEEPAATADASSHPKTPLDRLELGRFAPRAPQPQVAAMPRDRGRERVVFAYPEERIHEDDALRAIRERELACGRVTLDQARLLRWRVAGDRRPVRHQTSRQKPEGIPFGYLGRTVSERLTDESSDVERLGVAGLPVIHRPEELAELLDIPQRTLRWLAHHAEAAPHDHYVRFEVAKRNGGTRTLASPHATLRRCQRWILENVLSTLSVHDAAHGFVPGRSTLSHASAHVHALCQVQVDIRDFFPSITFPRVRGVFVRMGYSPAVATVLALLTTDAPRHHVAFEGERLAVATGERSLPQGACTSPALANRVARGIDRRFTALASKLGWRYGRYADDLTFSTRDAAVADRVGYLLARIRHVLADEGFALQPSKTRVLRPHTRQVVTGIVTNAGTGVPRELRRRLRAILHRARTEGLDAQNREGHPNFRSWLQGMIAYVCMVDPEQGASLRAEFESLTH